MRGSSRARSLTTRNRNVTCQFFGIWCPTFGRCAFASRLTQKHAQAVAISGALVGIINDYLGLEVAADLGTSERTLSRRLAEQGTSFEQLIDHIRKDLAMRYPNEGKFKLQERAFLLAFSTHARFTSAFKRWTGTTPVRRGAYREAISIYPL